MHQQEDFLRLFLRHEVELRAFIGSIVRDAHVREDVFQETALILWREFPRYDPARSFGAWARGVAAKKLLEERNSQRRTQLLFSPEAIQALAEAAEQAPADNRPKLEALEHCVARLPDRSRRLLALRYGQSQSPETIAGHLGMTITAVYQALWRLRAALRQCMERYLARQGAR
jgi:RNA polymerase sigma-70 factor (ECF subfamily)